MLSRVEQTEDVMRGVIEQEKTSSNSKESEE
jgi:hypothetical protein